MLKRENALILVVSQDPSIIETVRQAAGSKAVIDSVSSPAEALEKVRTTRPDIVLLQSKGPLDGQIEFYQELRHGWISRHSSVVLLETDPSGNSFRLLDENYLDVDLACPPGPVPPAIPGHHLILSLKETLATQLMGRENKLRRSLTGPSPFCIIWEQIPGLGSFEKQQETVLKNAAKAAAGGGVCGISVTDNPGGNPAIATEMLASEIRKLGVEPLVHMALRDRSRNQCESLLYQLAAMEIENLLVLTGDYPSNAAFRGKARPVFDLDAVTALQLISAMNRGMEYDNMLKKTILAPTSFFSGVAFSPYKQEESELMGQYYKLKKKIEAGADFIVTQVGYDVRKLHELQLWLKTHQYKIPAVATIYVPSVGTARAMHDNRVPGCVVTDKLLAEITEESKLPDKGRRARLDRAAKMYAIAHGLGFAGVSISGLGLPYEDLEYIINHGRELRSSWEDLVPQFNYPQTNGYYLFAASSKTGLNEESLAPKVQKASRPFIYSFSLMMHALIFKPSSPLFPVFRKFAPHANKSHFWRKTIENGEHLGKVILYSCQNCGDCSLFDVAFLCPLSQCPKDQRNGPCGGSYQGWCEVYPNEKKCVWVRAYCRLKSHHEEDSIGDNLVPPVDWSLWQTSSWLNYFNGRDHTGRKLFSEESQKSSKKQAKTQPEKS